VEGKLECERTIEDYSDLVLKAVGVDDAVVTYEMDERYIVDREGKKSAVMQGKNSIS